MTQHIRCDMPSVSHRLRSAKALSKYSDMVDSLARAQRDLLEGASDDARVKLREWELPEALNVRYVLPPEAV